MERGFWKRMFHETIQLIGQSLHLSALRNKAISHNVANVDTPGYKAKHVDFKSELEKNMNSLQAKKTHPRHLTFSTQNSPFIYERNTNYRHSRNNVDIDKEMTKLAENQIYYQAMVDRLNGEFDQLKKVIRGGN